MSDLGLRALVARFLANGQLGWTDPGSLWGWRVLEDREFVSQMVMETESMRLSPDDPAKIGAEAIIGGQLDVRSSDYVRKHTFRLAFEEARASWNAGDIGAAQTTMMRRIEEMQAMRVNAADRGWFFEDFEDRQERRVVGDQYGEFFPSGIDLLDRAMGGGLHRGEFEIPIAYSGIGKTFWCVQRGYIGAKMRRRVLHIALEGGRTKTEDRYEARFAQTLYRTIRKGDLNLDTAVMLRGEYGLLKHGLVLRGVGDEASWEAGFPFILGELQSLRREHGWVPDLIIVDYGDLLAAPGDNEYTRQKDSFRRLKALSERIEFPGHRGYAVCSPSQAQRPNKGADEREHVLKPRDIADCYEKVRVADIILSLNRTNDEKDAEQARVHLGKYRDAEDGATVRVSTDYTRGGFCRLYEPEPPPP